MKIEKISLDPGEDIEIERSANHPCMNIHNASDEDCYYIGVQVPAVWQDNGAYCEMLSIRIGFDGVVSIRGNMYSPNSQDQEIFRATHFKEFKVGSFPVPSKEMQKENLYIPDTTGADDDRDD